MEALASSNPMVRRRHKRGWLTFAESGGRPSKVGARSDPKTSSLPSKHFKDISRDACEAFRRTDDRANPAFCFVSARLSAIMPVRLGLTILFVVAGAVVAAACGDDDQGAGSSLTPTQTASPVSATPSPSMGVDEKPSAPPETPAGEEPTPGPAETPPPIATTGKRAPRVEDVPAFFAQFQNPPQDEMQCVYNPGTRVIDCSGSGLYAPDPPPTGQGIECFFMIADGKPAAARCEVASPQSTVYYDVR